MCEMRPQGIDGTAALDTQIEYIETPTQSLPIQTLGQFDTVFYFYLISFYR